jgi:hypothetical protein
MVECLREGAELLAGIDHETYVHRSPAVLHASVGGHYRHALDHFRNLLEAEHLVDYDRRERGTAVESDLGAALAETQRLTAMASDLPAEWAGRPLRVRTLACRGEDTPDETLSTAGREAVFCVMHAVHHYALIRVICGLEGMNLPPHFGVAPSTVAAGASA